jgi:hypothetical protein
MYLFHCLGIECWCADDLVDTGYPGIPPGPDRPQASVKGVRIGSASQPSSINQLKRECSSGYRGSSAGGGGEGEVGAHRAAQGGDVARCWGSEHLLRLRWAQSCQSMEYVG